MLPSIRLPYDFTTKYGFYQISFLIIAFPIFALHAYS
jgi:hypothetical protein